MVFLSDGRRWPGMRTAERTLRSFTKIFPVDRPVPYTTGQNWSYHPLQTRKQATFSHSAPFKANRQKYPPRKLHVSSSAKDAHVAIIVISLTDNWTDETKMAASNETGFLHSDLSARASHRIWWLAGPHWPFCCCHLFSKHKSRSLVSSTKNRAVLKRSALKNIPNNYAEKQIN